MYEAAKHSISSRTLVVNIWKLSALAVTAKRQIKTATKNDSLYHRQQHFSVVSNLLRPHFILLVFIATGCTLLLLTSVELCRKHWLERKMSVFFASECNHNSFRVVPLFSISQNAQRCNIEHMDRSCEVRFQHKLHHINKLY